MPVSWFIITYFLEVFYQTAWRKGNNLFITSRKNLISIIDFDKVEVEAIKKVFIFICNKSEGSNPIKNLYTETIHFVYILYTFLKIL